jgi:hypothetical protein
MLIEPNVLFDPIFSAWNPQTEKHADANDSQYANAAAFFFVLFFF